MGYIMPVDRYQYKQYQERMVTANPSIPPVNRTFQTVLDNKYEEVLRETDRLQENKRYRQSSAGKQVPRDYKDDERFKDLTGKGQNISLTI